MAVDACGASCGKPGVPMTFEPTTPGNSAEFLATYFACAKIGVVCVPINLFWRNRELAYVLEHAQVRGAVVEAEVFEQFLTGLEEGQALRDVIVVGDSDRGDHALPHG